MAKTVEHACAISCSVLNHAQAPRFPGQQERAAPLDYCSSILNSQGSERSRLLPGGPTGDIARRKPPMEYSLLSQIQKGEPRVWMPGLNIGHFLQSIQILTQGHCALSASSLRIKESGVLFGGCLSLHPKNIVWGS